MNKGRRQHAAVVDLAHIQIQPNKEVQVRPISPLPSILSVHTPSIRQPRAVSPANVGGTSTADKTQPPNRKRTRSDLSDVDHSETERSVKKTKQMHLKCPVFANPATPLTPTHSESRKAFDAAYVEGFLEY